MHVTSNLYLPEVTLTGPTFALLGTSFTQQFG